MITEIGKNIDKAKAILDNGGLVAIPTETVYGLAANALDENAIISVFETKGRPRFNPLILHVKSFEEATKYTKNIPDIAYIIANEFMPGPITFLLEKNELVSDIVTAGSNLVAIRVPNHKLTLELLNSVDFPLVAPSANTFGYVSPTSANHVNDNLGGKIEYILDGGECSVGIESTIIAFEIDEFGKNKIVVYRKGSFDLSKLEKFNIDITEKVSDKESIKVSNNINNNSETLSAPGRLKAHYSPNIKCVFGNVLEVYNLVINSNPNAKIAILSFDKSYIDKSNNNNSNNTSSQLDNVIINNILSTNSDLNEAAHNLFRELRYLENIGADLLILEPVPNTGIGEAINDRLERAAAKYIDID